MVLELGLKEIIQRRGKGEAHSKAEMAVNTKILEHKMPSSRKSKLPDKGREPIP